MTVPTDTLEEALRRLYLAWVADLPQHMDDVEAYIDQFKTQSLGIISRLGGPISRAGLTADFPAPEELPLSPQVNVVYDQMKASALRAGIASGLGPRELAEAMLSSGVGQSYNQLVRFARTEVVSAYWQNQWAAAQGTGLDMVWITEGGARTCPYCRSKDGLVIKDPTIRDHPNGRCTLAPTIPPGGLDWRSYREPRIESPDALPVDPTRPAPVAQWWLGQYGGAQAYRWNAVFRQGVLSAPWTSDAEITKLNSRYGSRLRNTVDDLAMNLKLLASQRTSSRAGVWRGENSTDILGTVPTQGQVVTLKAPTSTSVDAAEGIARLGDKPSQGVLYALDMPRGTIAMPGQVSEGEVILVPGSRVRVRSSAMETVTLDGESVTTLVVRGTILPPVVGEPYYGGQTRRIK